MRKSLWLRAYARKNRWAEEVVLVQFEMECAVRFFARRAADWKKWAALRPELPGHVAYALRQAAMWEGIRDHAEGAFSKAVAVDRP